MFLKIRGFFILGILAFCYFSFAGEATSYCDLDTGIVQDLDETDGQKIPYIRQAYLATEGFVFPSEILKQTEAMISREEAFRQKCGIAEGTNIAQLCVYLIYSNGEYECIETFDPRSCKGQFYLSGNDSVSFHQGKKKKASHSIEVQTVSQGDKGYIEIHQRLQPMLATIKDTVEFLSNIKAYVENFNNDMPSYNGEARYNALGLSQVAAGKRSEIKSLLAQRDEIIRRLQRVIVAMPSATIPSASSQETALPVEENLELASHAFIRAIHQELIACLEADDFDFNGMGAMKHGDNISHFIAAIQKTLSAKKLGELLNSKHFNLGCSEPLLLFDLFNDALQRGNLINRVTAPLKEKKPSKVKKEEQVKNEEEKLLKEIMVQLHSTKTPCKSCLIGCCGHLAPAGMINVFFRELQSELSQKFKILDTSLRFMISYNDFYGDKYPFYIPMIPTFPGTAETLLLMNMKFYNEEFKALKRRIIEEDRLKTKKILVQLVEEKKGNITLQDITKALQ